MHRENCDFNNIIRGPQWVLSIIIISITKATIVDKIGFIFFHSGWWHIPGTCISLSSSGQEYKEINSIPSQFTENI